MKLNKKILAGMMLAFIITVIFFVFKNKIKEPNIEKKQIENIQIYNNVEQNLAKGDLSPGGIFTPSEVSKPGEVKPEMMIDEKAEEYLKKIFPKRMQRSF
jgi:hypothetical protein